MTEDPRAVAETAITRLIKHLKRWSPNPDDHFFLEEAPVRFEACVTAIELAVAAAEQLAAEKTPNCWMLGMVSHHTCGAASSTSD